MAKEEYIFFSPLRYKCKRIEREITRDHREDMISQKGDVALAQIERACPSAAANQRAVSPPGIVYRLGIISGGARANGANIRETPS